MIGKTISHYRILEKIAVGGMGLVYKAEDIHLQRTVALKFLPEGLLQDGEAQRRFNNEAKAASLLDHPNICTIYEIGKTPTGQTFIAMAFYGGETVKQILQKGPMPLEDAVHIALRITDALMAAHESGIIHRDIKPANIMVTQRGEVKLLDFGLAKLVGEARITKSGIAVGTAAYMSPEQASGEESGHLTDIWSLGVVCYEMLCGSLPFKGTNPRSMLRSILNDPPQPIEGEALQIPEKLQAIILRCLNKEPRERYQDLRELRDDLSGISGVTIAEQKTEQIAASTREHPVLKIPLKHWKSFVAGIVLLVLLGLLFPLLYNGVRGWLGVTDPPPRNRVAVAPFVAVGENPESDIYVKGLTAFLVDKCRMMERHDPSFWLEAPSVPWSADHVSPDKFRSLWGVDVIISGKATIDHQNLKVAVSLLDAVSLEEIESISIAGHVTNLTLWQDEIILKVLRLLSRELPESAIEHLLGGGTSIPRAFSDTLQALGTMMSGDTPEQSRAALDLFAKAVGLDPAFALAHCGLAQACYRLYLQTESTEWLQKGQSHIREAIRLNGRISGFYMTAAKLDRKSGDLTGAIDLLTRGLSINPEDFEAQTYLAEIYEESGNARAAEDALKKAIAVRPDFSGAFDRLGYFYFQNNRFPEAVEMYSQVVRFSPADQSGFNNLGGLYFFMGEYGKATGMFESSYRIEPNAYARSNLATLYFFSGRYQDSVKLFEEAVELDKSDYLLWANLGDAYRFMDGMRIESIGAYREAVRLAVLRLSKDLQAEERAVLLAHLGRVKARMGFRQEALKFLVEARSLADSHSDVLYSSVIVYELNNDRERALEAARKYVDMFGALVYLQTEPDLVRLRQDPRYLELIKQ